MGDIAEAEHNYEMVSRHTIDYANFLIGIEFVHYANILQERGDIYGATNYYLRAYRINPTDTAARVGLKSIKNMLIYYNIENDIISEQGAAIISNFLEIIFLSWTQ